MEFVDKPWGHEEIWAITDKYVGKRLFIEAGHKLSRQYHEKKEETIWVMAGTLFLEIGPALDSASEDIGVVRLEEGEAYHIPPGTVHRFVSPEDEDVELIEVSTPELNDVVRLEDDYNRVSEISA